MLKWPKYAKAEKKKTILALFWNLDFFACTFWRRLRTWKQGRSHAFESEGDGKTDSRSFGMREGRKRDDPLWDEEMDTSLVGTNYLFVQIEIQCRFQKVTSYKVDPNYKKRGFWQGLLSVSSVVWRRRVSASLTVGGSGTKPFFAIFFRSQNNPKTHEKIEASKVMFQAFSHCNWILVFAVVRRSEMYVELHSSSSHRETWLVNGTGLWPCLHSSASLLWLTLNRIFQASIGALKLPKVSALSHWLVISIGLGNRIYEIWPLPFGELTTTQTAGFRGMMPIMSIYI